MPRCWGRAGVSEMLTAARDENPASASSSAATRNRRQPASGHFSPKTCAREMPLQRPGLALALVGGAARVYAMSSQLWLMRRCWPATGRAFSGALLCRLGPFRRPASHTSRGAATIEALFAASHLIGPTGTTLP